MQLHLATIFLIIPVILAVPLPGPQADEAPPVGPDQLLGLVNSVIGDLGVLPAGQ